MGFDLGSLFAGGIEGVLKGAKDVIGAFKADPTIVAQNAQKLAELELAIQKAEQDYELQLSLAQTEINKIEAQSTDKFVSRWRPSIGWICAAGLAYATIIGPLLSWLGANAFDWKQPPILNVEVLTTTLFAMLGIAGMRSFEKVRGVSTHG
jgi:uncharacterized membrane protein